MKYFYANLRWSPHAFWRLATVSLYAISLYFLVSCRSAAPGAPSVSVPNSHPAPFTNSSANSSDSLAPVQHCIQEPPSPTPGVDYNQMRPLSRAERTVLHSLEADAKVVAAAAASESGFIEPPKPVLRSELFQTIIPLQSVGALNLFVLAEPFAPESQFIRTFALLLEGKNGWQRRYLFPTKHDGNYEGGYDISLYSSNIDHDGLKELLFISHTGGSGAQINVEILQLRQKSRWTKLQITSLKVPSLHSDSSLFQDNFMVRVQLREQKRALLIQRLPLARQQNLNFAANGKWLGGEDRPWLYQKPNWVQFSKWQCDVRGDGRGENLLYTRQPLKGLANADTIGYFESFWLFSGGQKKATENTLADPKLPKTSKPRWILMRNNFVPAPGNEVLEYEALLP